MINQLDRLLLYNCIHSPLYFSERALRRNPLRTLDLHTLSHLSKIPNAFNSLNSAQLKTLAIAPKVSSMLSIVGSSYVIYRILTTDRSPNLRGRNSRSYSNLLLCLCIADFITSLAYFLSTWPIPKNNLYSDYIWGEAGNQITCSIQGELMVLSCEVL